MVVDGIASAAVRPSDDRGVQEVKEFGRFETGESPRWSVRMFLIICMIHCRCRWGRRKGI